MNRGVRPDPDAEHRALALAARPQPLADDVLAATAGEAVGRVDRVPAELDVAIEDRVAGLEVDVPAEFRSAEEQRERLVSGLAQRNADGLAHTGPDDGYRGRRMLRHGLTGALGRGIGAYAE